MVLLLFQGTDAEHLEAAIEELQNDALGYKDVKGVSIASLSSLAQHLKGVAGGDTETYEVTVLKWPAQKIQVHKKPKLTPNATLETNTE